MLKFAEHSGIDPPDAAAYLLNPFAEVKGRIASPSAASFDASTWCLLVGGVVIEGAKVAALTVRVAVLLVTLPVELLTVTVNGLPLSEVAVAGVV